MGEKMCVNESACLIMHQRVTVLDVCVCVCVCLPLFQPHRPQGGA